MNDQITIQCPTCKKRFKATSKRIGKKVKCSCGEIFLAEPTNDNPRALANGRVTKGTFLDKVVLEGACPGCGQILKLKEEEIYSGRDSCPECKQPFVVREEDIESARQLRTEIELLKEKKQAERTEREEEKARLPEQAGLQKAADKQDAIDMQTARLQQQERENTQHLVRSLGELSEQVKVDGLAPTEDVFPNVVRALNLIQIITYIITGIWLLVTVGLFGFGVFTLNAGAGGLPILLAIISAIGQLLFYIFSMAGIELYKMLTSIESQNRKANALMSMQIDLLKASIRS